MTSTKKARPPRAHYRKNEVFYGYLFIAPFYLLFLIFQLYPMLWSFVLSFYKWNGISPKTFVGLANYKAVLSDQMFWDSMRNTFWYLAANLLFILPLALLLGQLLCSRSVRARKLHKTILVLPTSPPPRRRAFCSACCSTRTSA